MYISVLQKNSVVWMQRVLRARLPTGFSQDRALVVRQPSASMASSKLHSIVL